MTRTTVRTTTFIVVPFVLAACSASSSRNRGKDTPGVRPTSNGEIMPTLYDNDRFFATPVTTAGDTVTLLLDTGDSGRLFEEGALRLGLRIDSVMLSRGPRRVVPLPEFKPGRAIPSPVDAPPFGTRTILTRPTDKFDTLMARRTMGQMGYQWFAERVWTFDYPGRRLILETGSRVTHRAGARPLAFDFRTDSLGRPINSVPRLPVVVDGDTLLLIFDTGATVWLTDAALTQLADGGPSERAWSLVRQSYVRNWRSRHPDWRFLEAPNRINSADMIEVPQVHIAGFTVGPVWFGTLSDPRTPSPRNLRLDGTLGGSALKYFFVTLDYPSKQAWFAK
jgi:hypothetical protein